jgi:hypothetical protein
MTSGFTSVTLYVEAIAVLAFIGVLFAPENYRRKL